MLKSMTGYGKETMVLQEKKIVIEIRTLNSRTLDANLRLPPEYREMELDLRSLLTEYIIRGKADLFLTIENVNPSATYKINRGLAKYYVEELKDLGKLTGIEPGPEILSAIFRLPDVISQSNENIPDEEKKAIIEATRKAMDKVNDFRIHEGAILADDFVKRIKIIIELLNSIEPFENKRIENFRKRLGHEMAKLADQVKIDANRFEQELIYYIEKLDFTEEKLRLRKHCENFLKTMEEDESQGRKLGFVVQEIGREINTLGSKANDSDIQLLIVQMKDELEKIKEQLLNIL